MEPGNCKRNCGLSTLMGVEGVGGNLESLQFGRRTRKTLHFCLTTAMGKLKQ